MSVFSVDSLFRFVANDSDLVTFDEVFDDLSGDFHIFYEWRPYGGLVSVDQQ
jgi:hypothetical protein